MHPLPQNIEVIVIGGSAGALEALSVIVPALPSDFAIPLVLVLHLPPTKPNYLPEILRSKCSFIVGEPDDKEPLQKKHLYVAPPNYHLLLESEGRFSLSVDPPVHFSRPSIDVLFESAAQAFGAGVAGVLLTGANEDGAHGLGCIKAAGGITLVQDPQTAPVPTMPLAGIQSGAAMHVIPLTEIAGFLAKLGSHALNKEVS